jgi:hypothetical protein
MSDINSQPAKGERAAITGYFAQYRISAGIIIGSLRRDDLRWIKIADPAAGKVDDFQICTVKRVDAYQIKWSQHPGNITFGKFTNSSDSELSLLRQLAEGWKLLKQANPSERVVVHLLTNASPSVSDSEAEESPSHFSAFLAECWEPVHKKQDSTNIPSKWIKAWTALRLASELEDGEFDEFITNCELNFRYSLSAKGESGSIDAQIYEDDIRPRTDYSA